MNKRTSFTVRRCAPLLLLLLLLLLLAGAGCGAAPAAAAGDLAAGKAAFAACASCHQLGPAARGGFGPQLNGVVGRLAGSSPDYSYSAAMKRSKIVWSERTLAAFIRDPDGVVPGTKMRFYSIGYDERKIADLVAYLRSVPAPD